MLSITLDYCVIENQENATLIADNKRLSAEVKELKEQVHLLLSKMYGRKSEHVDPDQLHLFATGAPEAVAEPVTSIAPSTRKKPAIGHGRESFPDHLPRNRIESEIAEEDRLCPDCGKVMCSIGTDITERGEFIPAKVIVNQYVRHRYACKDGHSVVTAPAPTGVIDRAKYEASVFAHIVTKKYADHVPLHRLEAIFKRQGFRIPKQTMWDMVSRVADLLSPVVKAMRAEVLSSPSLQADETPMKVALGSEKKMKQGYLWAYRGNEKVVYDFTTGRSRAGPNKFLADYEGLLQTDAYPGYDEICARNKIKRAGCWAHARRKFKESMDSSPRESAECLIQINRLFRIERRLKEKRATDRLTNDEFVKLRAEVRARFSKRVLIRLMECLRTIELEGRFLPKSLLGKAMTYIANQKEPLSLFLTEPLVELDNNAVERDMKHIAVGRKGYSPVAKKAAKLPPRSSPWSPLAKPTTSIRKPTSRTSLSGSTQHQLRTSAH